VYEGPRAVDRFGRLTRQATLEDRYGAVQVALEQARASEAAARYDEAIARIAGLGDTQRLLGGSQPLVEVAQLGEAQGEPGARQYRGQPDHLDAVVG